jgi:hypothetical protein
MAKKCECGNEIAEGLNKCDACKRKFSDNVKKAGNYAKKIASALAAGAGVILAVANLFPSSKRKT